jgi:phage terminase small subunit
MEQKKNISKAALAAITGAALAREAARATKGSPMAYRRNRKRPLNVRQQKFVEQFLLTGIGREAAIRAGYSAKGATESACRLRRLPYIAEAIRQGRAAEARRAQVARERVLLELARVAFSDIGDVLDWTSSKDITLRPKDQISPHHRAAIAELAAPRADAGLRIKLHSKSRAIDALARHLGVFDKIVPAVDFARRAREREVSREKIWRRINEIVEERIAERCKRGELMLVAASLAAGAPLDVPVLASDASAEKSSPPQPSPLEGEGRVGSPLKRESQGGGESRSPLTAIHTPAPEPPALPSTFPASFTVFRK